MWHALAVWSTAYTVAICGAQGRLGSELVCQSLARGWDVKGIVRRARDPVPVPMRAGWLVPERGPETAVPLPVHIDLIDSSGSCDWVDDCDAIVFAMSGTPFAQDSNTTQVVERACARMTAAQRACLVSAHGVGDSIVGANAGIRVMRSWYLRPTYEAKQEQEALMTRCKAATRILRPKVLSFSPVPFNPDATPRECLARHILDWVST